MTTSPLQFAKDFSKLKSDLALQPAADLKLLLLVDFWLVLEQHRDNKAYRSYFDEYIPLLLHLISEENLHDLTLEELEELLITLQSVKETIPPDDRAQAQNKIRLTTICLAKMLFYVGCVEEGAKLCAGLAGEASAIANDFNDLDDLSELNALKVACDRFKDKRPSLYNIIKDVLNAWEGERETLSHERANCLFVEKADQAQSWRGRLRVLVGSVETYGKQKKGDDVTFENQIKSPDDPFIGVAYDSLEAVRQIFKAEGFKDKAGTFYHAHFSIRAAGAPGRAVSAPGRDSTHTFTGDSIGLAVGLVTYTQLLKPEIMRQERFLAADVAFTGGVNEQGQLLAVNKETLGVKVERAFFSPVKYLVLPEANLVAAKEHLEKLRERFPGRRLRLVGAERLSEVIENHNVIRAEKVCMGEFVVRKVYRYSRMTKVQVPLLVALLYLMICLLYPKASIFFDWNPQYVKMNASCTGFVVMNADSVELWGKQYECDTLKKVRDAVADLDGDGRNDVVIIPSASETRPCKSSVILHVYSDKGNLLFRRDCIVFGEYPGDSTPDLHYTPGDIAIAEVGNEPIILTLVTQEYPARTHIKIWRADGKLLGWYVNAGHCSFRIAEDWTSDGRGELLFHGFNNRMGCQALFILHAYSSQGVSPPYSDSNLDLSWVKRGNQLQYVLFPPSDLCRANSLPYGPDGRIIVEADEYLRVDVYESKDREALVTYYLDKTLRVTTVTVSDIFLTRRNRLVMKRLLPSVDWDTYLEYTRDTVTYWTDSGWVSEGQLRAAEKLK